MENWDLYGILGVSPSASTQDIRSAFRRLAAALHPDLHPGSEDLFKEVSRAYAVLADPGMRERYDRSLRGAWSEVDAPISPAYPGGQGRTPTKEWWATRNVWESQGCPDCGGSGRVEAVDGTCIVCNGWGAVALRGRTVEWRTCGICHGLGHMDMGWCARCWGMGTARTMSIETYRTPPRLWYR